MARESFCSCRSLSSKVMPRTLRLLANVPATILPKKKTTGQTTSKEEGISPPSLPPRHPHVSPYWVPASPTSVRHRCWIIFQYNSIWYIVILPADTTSLPHDSHPRLISLLRTPSLRQPSTQFLPPALTTQLPLSLLRRQTMLYQLSMSIQRWRWDLHL